MIPVISEKLYKAVKTRLVTISGLQHMPFIAPFSDSRVIVPSHTRARWISVAYCKEGAFGITENFMLFHNFFHVPCEKSKLWKGSLLGAELLDNKLYFADLYAYDGKTFLHEPFEVRQQKLRTLKLLLAEDIPSSNLSRTFCAGPLI